MLYPLKFNSIYKTKVWGGNNIKDLKNDISIPDKCGESWEISGVSGDLSKVKNGFLEGNTLEEIIEVYMGELVGDSVFEKFGYEFPILIKIIDANENLSIQVHPDDEAAAERHHARGKSELWYVLKTDENAELVSGFKEKVNFRQLLDSIESDSIEELLNLTKTKPGEVYYIPAGRIHSLGKGNMILEIQETSDVTYRIYDYGRKDRELHLGFAEDVLDYSKTGKLILNYKSKPDKSNQIIRNQHFTINYLPVMNNIERDYYELDSFVLYYCVNGEIIIKTDDNAIELKSGETILIPAVFKSVFLIPKTYSELVEVYLEL